MVTASVSDTVSLECRATGSPTPEIRWRHTRPNNKLSNDIEGEYITGTVLTITNIKVEDRGEYECIASNAEAEKSKTTFIRIYCKYTSQSKKFLAIFKGPGILKLLY